MTSIRRRAFLSGSAVVAPSSAVASPVTWASSHPGSGTHERGVRDARMEWRRLPIGYIRLAFAGTMLRLTNFSAKMAILI